MIDIAEMLISLDRISLQVSIRLLTGDPRHMGLGQVTLEAIEEEWSKLLTV